MLQPSARKHLQTHRGPAAGSLPPPSVLGAGQAAASPASAAASATASGSSGSRRQQQQRSSSGGSRGEQPRQRCSPPQAAVEFADCRVSACCLCLLWECSCGWSGITALWCSTCVEPLAPAVQQLLPSLLTTAEHPPCAGLPHPRAGPDQAGRLPSPSRQLPQPSPSRLPSLGRHAAAAASARQLHQQSRQSQQSCQCGELRCWCGLKAGRVRQPGWKSALLQ